MPTNRPIRRPTRCRSIQTFEPLESRRLLSGGLVGQYFDNPDFTGASITRVDSTINFAWGTGKPADAIAADTFSVRWQGLVRPQYTQYYTFYLNADDGARLWIDGQLVIDTWHTGGEGTGVIRLDATRASGILLEYREDTGNAGVRLEWSSASQPRQLIPSSRLSPIAPHEQTLRIMAIGDSVTEGDTNHASYRFWLHQNLLSAGFNFDLVGTRRGNHVQWVGTQGEPLYPWFDQDHQSRWGAQLDESHNSINQWASQKPDVVLIHIGHNDIRNGKTPQQMINHLSTFIDDLRSKVNPNVRIALAMPIANFSLGSVAEMDAYRAMIPGLAASKSTAQSPIVVVDQYAGFNPDIHTYDTVHPNAAGEQQIAARFFDAIVQLVGRPTLRAPENPAPAPTPAPPPPSQPATGNIDGFVFEDLNGNGIQDAGEPGLAGRYVYLDYNNNAQRDANEPILVTNKNGRYLFKSVKAGSYRVRHHLGNTAIATAPSASQHIVRVGEAHPSATWDFGIQMQPKTPARVSGVVFSDVNNDGKRDAQEKGIANRYIFIDANNNGLFDPGERYVISGADGSFTFSNLVAGVYRIGIHIGPAVRSTTPNGGIYTLNITAGQNLTGYNFGLAMV